MFKRIPKFLRYGFTTFFVVTLLHVLVFAQSLPELADFGFVFETSPIPGVVSRTVVQKLNERVNTDGQDEIQIQLFKYDPQTNSRIAEGQSRPWISKQSFESIKRAQAKFETENKKKIFYLNDRSELVFFHPYRDREEKVVETKNNPVCLAPSSNDELVEDVTEILDFANQQVPPRLPDEAPQIEKRLLDDFNRIKSLRLNERFDLETSAGLISARNELWQKIHDWYEGDDEKALQLAASLTLFGEFRGHWTPAHGFYFMKVMENREDQNFLDYHKGLAKTPSLRIFQNGEPTRLGIGDNWLLGTYGPIMLDPNGIDAWDGVSRNDNLREILKMDLIGLNKNRLQDIAKFMSEYSNGQWEMLEIAPNLSRLTAYDSPAALIASNGSDKNPNMHILPALPKIKNRETGEVSSVQLDHFRGGEDDALRNIRLAKQRRNLP